MQDLATRTVIEAVKNMDVNLALVGWQRSDEICLHQCVDGYDLYLKISDKNIDVDQE